MGNMVGGLIGLTLGIVVLSNVLITTVKDTNTSTWSTGEVALWGMISLGAIGGMVYGVLALFGLV